MGICACRGMFYQLHLFFSIFKGLLELGPSEKDPLITEKVKFTFYYEVILDILGYFNFLLHYWKYNRKLKQCGLFY